MNVIEEVEVMRGKEKVTVFHRYCVTGFDQLTTMWMMMATPTPYEVVVKLRRGN